VCVCSLFVGLGSEENKSGSPPHLGVFSVAHGGVQPSAVCVCVSVFVCVRFSLFLF